MMAPQSGVSDRPPAPAVADVPFWISGRRTSPSVSRRGEVTNPSTGDVIRSVPFASATEVDAAVNAAAAAFPAWRETTPLRRARILTRFRELLEQHQEEIASLISEEHGK